MLMMHDHQHDARTLLRQISGFTTSHAEQLNRLFRLNMQAEAFQGTAKDNSLLLS
jgi:hypothetical protein